MSSCNQLLQEIKACTACSEHLPLGPNPVLTLSETAPVMIVGQAPGLAVHRSGIPWDDKSGQTFREWLGVTPEQFYDPSNFSIVPAAFCYPGRGSSGDLPPRPECSKLWHPPIRKLLRPKLIILAGWHAQQLYLGPEAKDTLTETVKNFKEYLPWFFPLPHPSPRNNIWQARNPWFKKTVIPHLKEISKAWLRTEPS